MNIIPPTPHRKVGAGALAGGLSIIVVWAAKTFAHQDVPAEIASAITTVLTFMTSYLVPNAE